MMVITVLTAFESLKTWNGDNIVQLKHHQSSLCIPVEELRNISIALDFSISIFCYFRPPLC